MRSMRTQLLGAMGALILLGAGAAAQAQDAAPPPAGAGGGHVPIEQRFQSADANGDGHLTRDEAQAKLPMVYKNFDTIDSGKKGYVTLADVKAWMAARRASRAQPTQ